MEVNFMVARIANNLTMERLSDEDEPVLDNLLNFERESIKTKEIFRHFSSLTDVDS